MVRPCLSDCVQCDADVLDHAVLWALFARSRVPIVHAAMNVLPPQSCEPSGRRECSDTLHTPCATRS